jgi:hypothetical protein
MTTVTLEIPDESDQKLTPIPTIFTSYYDWRAIGGKAIC